MIVATQQILTIRSTRGATTAPVYEMIDTVVA
jgi:hypothetical protein